MAQQTMTQQGSPVDNNTYNLLQVLTSKLEAIEAYTKYEQDADDTSRQILQQLAQQDRDAVQRLLDALRQTLGSR